MAQGLKSEKAPGPREMAFGRHFLRAALAVLFAIVTVVLALQEVSIKTGAHWLLYLALFVATDQIAGAVLRRIERQGEADPGPR